MSELCLDVVMDDLDRDNLLVLTTFAGSVVAVIVGYLLAWRAKRTGTAPPDGTYKTALQFRNLMLLVVHWSAPNSELLMAAGIHIPLWPLRQVNLAHHEQLPPHRSIGFVAVSAYAMRIFLKCEDARSMTFLAVDYGSGFFPNRILPVSRVAVILAACQPSLQDRGGKTIWL